MYTNYLIENWNEMVKYLQRRWLKRVSPDRRPKPTAEETMLAAAGLGLGLDWFLESQAFDA